MKTKITEKEIWASVAKANAQAAVVTQQLVDEHDEGETLEFCALVYRFYHSKKTIVLQNPDKLDETLNAIVKENFARIGWKVIGTM